MKSDVNFMINNMSGMRLTVFQEDYASYPLH